MRERCGGGQIFALIVKRLESQLECHTYRVWSFADASNMMATLKLVRPYNMKPILPTSCLHISTGPSHLECLCLVHVSRLVPQLCEKEMGGNGRSGCPIERGKAGQGMV